MDLSEGKESQVGELVCRAWGLLLPPESVAAEGGPAGFGKGC